MRFAQPTIAFAVLLCAVGAGAPAGAAPDEEVGACTLSAHGLRTSFDSPPYQYDGTLTASGTAVFVSSPPGAPPTVSCEIQADGTTVAGMSSTSGTPVTGRSERIAFSVWGDEYLELCVTIRYDIGFAYPKCEPITALAFPGDDVWDSIDAGLVEVLKQSLDPVTCGVVGVLPDIPGVMELDGGDVAVLGYPIYDCPPYDPGWGDIRVWYVTLEGRVAA